jgi:hypothetical protein
MVTGIQEEFLAGPGVGQQQAVQRGGDRRRPGRASAAQRHAHVLGDQDHPDAPGLQAVVQPVGDLLGEALLNLRPAGEQLHQPGELGQPQDPLAGQVGHVSTPRERQEMVLAHRPEADLPLDHQLLVTLVVREGRRVEAAGSEHLVQRPGHPRGRLGQAPAPHIHAERGQQRLSSGPGGAQIAGRCQMTDRQRGNRPGSRGHHATPSGRTRRLA